MNTSTKCGVGALIVISLVFFILTSILFFGVRKVVGQKTKESSKPEWIGKWQLRKMKLKGKSKEPPQPEYWVLTSDSLHMRKGIPGTCESVSFEIVKATGWLTLRGVTGSVEEEKMRIAARVPDDQSMKVMFIREAIGAPRGAMLNFGRTEDPVLDRESCN